MDAKDLQIEKLKAELQHKETQLQTKEAELNTVQSQHVATTEQFAKTIEEKDRAIRLLELHIKRLLRTVRGSRQERINPDQMLLFSPSEMEQIAKEIQGAQAEPEKSAVPVQDTKSPKRKSRRRLLPSNLPREVIRHELSEEQCKCTVCGQQRVEFGVETSEQLEFMPAKWKIIEHQRVKYACRCDEGSVSIATKPPQPIEKGVPGPGLCAFTVLSKFGDHLPLYREEDMHSRAGWLIRRSTICGWLYELAILSEPLVMRMKHLTLQSQVIHTDDTKIKMLAPHVCHEAKFWPYLGDWLHRYAVYDFTLDRTRDGPQKFLKDFKGYLQADAFSGYDCVYAPGNVTEVGCWIHARRYWYESKDYDQERANIALGFIARLSQIEVQLRESFPEMTVQGERDFAAIAAARQRYSVPILNEFKAWLDREMHGGRILPKSVIKTAFNYTLNQWQALCRYTEQGYLAMDNNAAERMVKHPAIGRKNYLFVGNERAGRNAAIFYSLVVSAKLNGVEPFEWLRTLYTRLPYYRSSEAFKQSKAGEPVTSDELDPLLPDCWLKENPSHTWSIDTLRREERRQKEKSRRLQRRNRRHR
jgi:transposase